MEHLHPLSFGTVSVSQKGGSLQMTIPAYLARLMELNVNDELKISFDPITKEMIVSRELTRVVTKKEAEVLLLLQEAQVYLPRGHYELDSGKHSQVYIHIRLALANDNNSIQIGQYVLDSLGDEPIQAVVGFTVGGFKLAKSISTLANAKLIIGEKATIEDKKSIVFHNLDEIEKNDRILIVDDVLTTGGSLKAVIEIIKRKKPDSSIVAAAVVVDRSNGIRIDLGVNLISLTSISLQEYEPELECPMCKAALPLVSLRAADFDAQVTLNSLPKNQKKLMTEAYDEYQKAMSETKIELNSRKQR